MSEQFDIVRWNARKMLKKSSDGSNFDFEQLLLVNKYLQFVDIQIASEGMVLSLF